MIKNDEVALIVNTTEGKQAVRESRSIRREAVARRVTYYTTVAGARATCDALDHLGDIEVNRLQDLHKEVARRETNSHDSARRRAAAAGVETAEERGAAERHQGDRRGARPRRSVRECRIPRGARTASFIEGRINEIEHRLSNSEVIDVTKLNASGRVVFGSTVELEDQDGSVKVVYQLVGDDEADIKEGIAVGLLAHRAGAHRQVGRRRGRRDGARAARAPTRSSSYATCDP
jgi:hypothetical protein